MRAIQLFRDQLDAGQLDTIYDTADPDLGKSTTRDASRAYFADVRAKMGACERAGVTTFNEVVTTQAKLMTVHYKRDCANGPLTETFTFRISPSGPNLLRYEAMSRVLPRGQVPQE